MPGHQVGEALEAEVPQRLHALALHHLKPSTPPKKPHKTLSELCIVRMTDTCVFIPFSFQELRKASKRWMEAKS